MSSVVKLIFLLQQKLVFITRSIHAAAFLHVIMA